jgi:hypoxanthine phosphoribosyltransferase
MNKIKKLINERDINRRVKEISETLYDEYKDEEVVFICTLKGAVFFACDLLKKYKGDARIEFLRVSSYSGKDSTGKIELNLSISKENIENKNVIILEDIVDTGTTLKFLKEYIGDMKPKSLIIVSLLDKKERRKVDIEADIVGFEIEDLFVVGYGLDYDQKYRNLPYIGVIE